jgi:hypothetical protein
MKAFLFAAFLLTVVSCSKPETENCTNVVVKEKLKQDFNGVTFAETTYKNSCTGETFIVNLY